MFENPWQNYCQLLYSVCVGVCVWSRRGQESERRGEVCTVVIWRKTHRNPCVFIDNFHNYQNFQNCSQFEWRKVSVRSISCSKYTNYPLKNQRNKKLRCNRSRREGQRRRSRVFATILTKRTRFRSISNNEEVCIFWYRHHHHHHHLYHRFYILSVIISKIWYFRFEKIA